MLLGCDNRSDSEKALSEKESGIKLLSDFLKRRECLTFKDQCICRIKTRNEFYNHPNHYTINVFPKEFCQE